MTNDKINVDVDVTYTIPLSQKTHPEYSFAKRISEWLVQNLSNLTDDNGDEIFSKVNTGFDESNLRTFGQKPTCDVYIDNVEYDPTYDYSKPTKVNSIIIFYSRGGNNNAYYRACAVHDYLLQELVTNDSFQSLPGIVDETIIRGSRLMNQPIQKRWGVMGAFELTHNVY